jgi:hypothetical protein
VQQRSETWRLWRLSAERCRIRAAAQRWRPVIGASYFFGYAERAVKLIEPELASWGEGAIAREPTAKCAKLARYRRGSFEVGATVIHSDISAVDHSSFCSSSRAPVNQLIAAERRGTSGTLGRPLSLMEFLLTKAAV